MAKYKITDATGTNVTPPQLLWGFDDVRNGARVVDTVSGVEGTVEKPAPSFLQFWSGGRTFRIRWDNGTVEEWKKSVIELTNPRLREIARL